MLERDIDNVKETLTAKIEEVREEFKEKIETVHEHLEVLEKDVHYAINDIKQQSHMNNEQTNNNINELKDLLLKSLGSQKKKK